MMTKDTVSENIAMLLCSIRANPYPWELALEALAKKTGKKHTVDYLVDALNGTK